jgi:PPP family 3-phenylpropionic acid transporter
MIAPDSYSTPVRRSMLVPKAFYFLFFGAMASLVPYLNLHYEQIGLSSRQIGLLSGMSPLLTLVGAPLWGGLADATQRQRLLLILAIAGSSLAVWLLSLFTAFLWLIPVVAVYAFLVAPIMPLVDSWDRCIAGVGFLHVGWL